MNSWTNGAAAAVGWLGMGSVIAAVGLAAARIFEREDGGWSMCDGGEADRVRMADVLVASDDVDLSSFIAVHNSLAMAGFTLEQINAGAGEAVERARVRRGHEGARAGQLVGGSVGRRAVVPLVAGAMFFAPLQSPPLVPAHVGIDRERAAAIWAGLTAEDVLWLEGKFVEWKASRANTTAHASGDIQCAV